MIGRVALGFVLLPIFVFAGARAFGDDLGWAVGGDGNQLITACKSAVQTLDEPSREFTKQEVYNIGWCQGLVSGVADATQNAGLIGIQRGQMVRIVQKYLVDHPEKLSLSAVFLVREALVKAFPMATKK
jgi:Rap1a immunity proteins